jgi:hypothetical protein
MNLVALKGHSFSRAEERPRQIQSLAPEGMQAGNPGDGFLSLGWKATSSSAAFKSARPSF